MQQTRPLQAIHSRAVCGCKVKHFEVLSSALCPDNPLKRLILFTLNTIGALFDFVSAKGQSSEEQEPQFLSGAHFCLKSTFYIWSRDELDPIESMNQIKKKAKKPRDDRKSKKQRKMVKDVIMCWPTRRRSIDF